MGTSDTPLTYRRLRPDAPVGLLARACLALHPRGVACARCMETCPVKVLRLTETGMELGDGCLGCGRCAAVCPTGAIAVRGFSCTPDPEPARDTLALDCWKVPRQHSPPGAVRVPCLGGLSASQLLALRYAGGNRRLALLDRGWCGQCAAAGNDAHPAQAALSTTRDWLREIGAPASHWPVLDKQPLPVSLQRPDIADDAAASPVSRRAFVSRLAREVAATVGEVTGFRLGDDGAGKPVRPANSLAPVRPIERERRLLILERLAQRYGGTLPGSLFPRVTIGPECRDNRLCASLCPTGALGVYDNRHERGVTFEAAACIACGQCERVCPEQAVRLAPAGRRARTAPRPRVLTRTRLRNCTNCHQQFTRTEDVGNLCPACRRSQDLAKSAFDALFRRHVT